MCKEDSQKASSTARGCTTSLGSSEGRHPFLIGKERIWNTKFISKMCDFFVKMGSFQEYVVKISFENLNVSTLQLQEARNELLVS